MTKAIAVAGIVLGMEFLHSLGLIQGGLKPSNVLFDEFHRIQIVHFARS
jgi:serine/threonine protein kinase